MTTAVSNPGSEETVGNDDTSPPREGCIDGCEVISVNLSVGATDRVSVGVELGAMVGFPVGDNEG